ncbi:lytic transglycosylase domain-containing protein [soil metagenome]
MHAAGLAVLGIGLAGAAGAASPDGAAAAPDEPSSIPAAATVPVAPDLPPTRSGREIYARFREGLADPVCEADASPRWSQHFAHVPGQLAQGRGDVLSLFGYVVDALREAQLPTEYALIPFVESGYKPGARSAAGPAGLWQFIAVTARNHKIAIGPGYDGRLSPVDSTRAAVRYLKTLHGMFAGDWRLAVMGFNAGEYRVLGALRRHGQRPMAAEPSQLTSLAPVTQAYVRKLHALSCMLAAADDREDWLRALDDRQVPRLAAIDLPPGIDRLDAWATRHAHDPALVQRLNPAFANGAIARVAAGAKVLVPFRADMTPPALLTGSPPTPVASTAASVDPGSRAAGPVAAAAGRTHTVAPGDSPWRIARRYGITVAQLLARNSLDARSVLRPGMVLVLDAPAMTEAAVAH